MNLTLHSSNTNEFYEKISLKQMKRWAFIDINQPLSTIY